MIADLKESESKAKIIAGRNNARQRVQGNGRLMHGGAVQHFVAQS